MRKPFYKQSHKAWYVHHDGKPVKLVKGPKDATQAEAMLKWAAMQGVEQPEAEAEPIASGPTLGKAQQPEQQ